MTTPETTEPSGDDVAGRDRYQPWVKLWWDWYSRREHAGLSERALALGGLLLNLAKASPDPGWLLTEAGTGHTPLAIGRLARVQGSARRVEQLVLDALLELEAAGTLVRRADGAWGFGAYWRRSQEAASKRRTKAYRKRKAAEPKPEVEPQAATPERHEERHGDAPGDAPVTPAVTPPTAPLDPESARLAAIEAAAARAEARRKLFGVDRGDGTRVEYDDTALGARAAARAKGMTTTEAPPGA